MGQKTNPNVLRLRKINDWNSKYIEKKPNEFYLYTSKDLEIKKFIFNFFKANDLIVHNCKIDYLNNNLNIYITYQQSVNSISKINTINKIQKIKLIKKINFIKKPHKKNSNTLLKNIKNYFNYENLSYTKKLLKKPTYSNKFLKLKRIKLLKYYKKHISLKKNKNITNLFANYFLNKLFQSLILFYNKSLNITLIIKSLNTNTIKTINKNQQIFLKKKLIKLKKYQRNEFFKEGVNLIFSSLFNKNSANLLSNYIAINLKKLKRHNFFLRFVKTILNIFLTKTFSTLIKGIKIKIKGRINGAPRAKQKLLTIGSNMPILTLDSSINYSETIAYTSNGTIGVKVWICEKK
jgi:ribosomal protein S3